MPIRKTSKKSAGVRCRVTASHPKSSTRRSEPSVATTLGRRNRVARLGADASAATVGATLLRRTAKSYGNDPVSERRRVGSTMRAQAEVAELADAPDSKSGSLRGVWVRFPPSAPPPGGRRGSPDGSFFFDLSQGGSTWPLPFPPWPLSPFLSSSLCPLLPVCSWFL